jgi:hypothetical protein
MPYDTPLPVRIAAGASVWQPGSLAAAPSGVEATLLAYSVAGSPVFLDELSMTGEFPAEFHIYLNGASVETERTEIARPVARLPLYGYRLDVGQQVVVKVTHYHVGALHAFSASLKAHR